MYSQDALSTQQSPNIAMNLSSINTQDIEQRFNKLEVNKNIKEDYYKFRPFFDEVLDIKDRYGNAGSSCFLNIIADDKTQKTALHLEAEGGCIVPSRRFWLIKFMLQEGADFSKVDALGNTALHLVMSNFEFLVSSAKSDQDRIYGTARTQMAIAACLLAHDANPTVKNNAGLTPWNCLQQALNKANLESLNKVKDIYSLQALSSAYSEEIADGVQVKSYQSALNFKKHRVFHNYCEVVGLENITKWEGKVTPITLPKASSGCAIQ